MTDWVRCGVCQCQLLEDWEPADPLGELNPARSIPPGHLHALHLCYDCADRLKARRYDWFGWVWPDPHINNHARD